MRLYNFNTALYIARLQAGSKYDGLLKIGISNDIERRAKEIGNVVMEYKGEYKAPRALVMATEMLAHAFAYRKVGRPNNYRQALPVRSGSSEFFKTENIRQARGFISAAKTRINYLADEHGYNPFLFDDDEKEQLTANLKDLIAAVIQYVKKIFKAMKKRLPKSFTMEVVRIKQTLAQEAGA